MLEENVAKRRINIYWDRQAAIRALHSPCTRSRLVQESREVVNVLGSQNNVRIGWVPGHSRLIANEKADELAMKGEKNH